MKCIKSLKDIFSLKEENVNKIITEQYSHQFPDMSGIEYGAIIDTYLSFDSDLELFLGSINCKINGIIKENDYLDTNIKGMNKGSYFFLSDETTGCYVEFKELKNRHSSDYPNEMFLNFKNIYLI